MWKCKSTSFKWKAWNREENKSKSISFCDSKCPNSSCNQKGFLLVPFVIQISKRLTFESFRVLQKLFQNNLLLCETTKQFPLSYPLWYEFFRVLNGWFFRKRNYYSKMKHLIDMISWFDFFFNLEQVLPIVEKLW